MNKKPEISIVMSVYNGEDYLAEAIESVLKQSFSDWELIIINDCSTDRTGEILNLYASIDERIKVYLNEVNLRLPSSLNRALLLSRGKYIARMDADDICLPDRLEKQHYFMETHADVALSSCRFMTLKNGVISSGGCGGQTDTEAIKALLLVTNPILHPGVIAKAEIIKSLEYDKNLTCTEDLELWTRFIMAGYPVEIQPEYLMIYRLHDKQITETTLEKQRHEVVTIQKRYYGNLLETMTGEQESFYIRGIYFRESIDVGQFCRFCKWARNVNRRIQAVKPEKLNYALFEILAEYKRKEISKKDLVKAMLPFGIGFLTRELAARKRRAFADGVKCIEAARRIGLEQIDGNSSFPIFKKRK